MKSTLDLRGPRHQKKKKKKKIGERLFNKNILNNFFFFAFFLFFVIWGELWSLQIPSVASLTGWSLFIH
jgi:cell division protein FtsI/penicillin-binding protein 2